MNDRNLQNQIYKLICTRPTNIFAAADLAQEIMVLFKKGGPATKHYIAIDDEAATERIKGLERIVDVLTRERQAAEANYGTPEAAAAKIAALKNANHELAKQRNYIKDNWDNNVCVLRETLKSTEAREVILQDKVRDLKNANRTAGGENMEKLQGQVQFLIKQRNDATLQRNKAERQLREQAQNKVSLITSEGEKLLRNLLNLSSSKVKRSGRVMNTETSRRVSNQIIEDLKEAGANGLFTLVHLRNENHSLQCQLGTQANRAMDQSQKIVELERSQSQDRTHRIAYQGQCQHDFGKFDKVIMDPQHVEHLKAVINGEEVTTDTLQERIEKLETHNDNLKAKVRRVVEESSNLEEALLKVARGN